MSQAGPNRNHRVWAVVEAIPLGRVATYGQIAALAEIPGPSGARQVGYALAALAFDNTLPWHRVINARGGISKRANRRDGRCDFGPSAADEQYERLVAEGIEFDLDHRLDLQRFQWQI